MPARTLASSWISIPFQLMFNPRICWSVFKNGPATRYYKRSLNIVTLPAISVPPPISKDWILLSERRMVKIWPLQRSSSTLICYQMADGKEVEVTNKFGRDAVQRDDSFPRVLCGSLRALLVFIYWVRTRRATRNRLLGRDEGAQSGDKIRWDTIIIKFLPSSSFFPLKPV